MRLAQERGAKVLAVTNIMGSQATRDADGVLYTRAGLEVGVAATKTFVAQVAAMYLLALRLAELRGTLAPERLRELVADLKHIPHHIDHMLGNGLTAAIDRTAEAHHSAEFFLYLGRHVGLPVCLEGALKLKEISYIATDAYAAGEMKHGPIALLSEKTPGRRRRHRVAGAREGRLEHAGGARPRRARHRRRQRGRHRHRRARRGGAARPPHGLDAAADPRGRSRCSCWPTGSRGCAG